MSRNKEMLELLLDGKTYQQIGDQFNVSRQRVQQILSPPKYIRDIVIRRDGERCSLCGIIVGQSGHIHHKDTTNGENYEDIENLQLLCISCHRKKHSTLRYCKNCGKEFTGVGLYCSDECKDIYHNKTCKTELVCANCGKAFVRGNGAVKSRLIPSQQKQKRTNDYFCSRQCQGKYIGRTFGFVSHPENIRGNGKPSRFVEFLPEIIKRYEDGESIYKIASEIGKRLGFTGENSETVKKLIGQSQSI